MDRDIVGLLARRLHLAEEIGLEKRLAGLPVRHTEVEERVFERLRKECEAHGLPGEIAQPLGSLLIEESVRRQEAVALPRPLGRRAVVVGGAGRMGRWLGRYLRSLGYQVVVVDPAGSPDGFLHEANLSIAMADADVVAIAAPLTAVRRILEEVASHKPGALVFDLGSLKGPFADALRSGVRAGVRVASVHPLFGPNLWPMSRGTILVCDCGDPEAAEAAKSLFRSTGATLLDVPLDDHDEFMGSLLGLSHLTLLAFVRAASRGPLEPSLAATEGTTYARLANVTRGLLEDSPELLRDIQSLNPDAPHVFRRLRQALADWERAASDSDPKEFFTLLEHARAFLGGGTP